MDIIPKKQFRQEPRLVKIDGKSSIRARSPERKYPSLPNPDAGARSRSFWGILLVAMVIGSGIYAVVAKPAVAPGVLPEGSPGSAPNVPNAASPTPTAPSPTSILSVSGDRIFYTNTKYGFSFNFPKNWSLVAENAPLQSDPLGEVAVYVASADQKYSFSILVGPSRPNDQVFKGDREQRVKINGVEQTAFLTIVPQGTDSSSSYAIPIERGGKWFILGGRANFRFSIPTSQQSILDSFKFIN